MEKPSRRDFIKLAGAAVLGAALAACGPAVTPDSPATPISKPSVKELPKIPTPELGAIKETKVGEWDTLIDDFIKENPLAQTAIQKGYDDGIEFFAVSITHRHGTPMDNKRGVMILPVSPDLPESIRGVNQTIYYAIGTGEGRLLPFPERSHIGSLPFTPGAAIDRQVFDEFEKAYLNKNVIVVQTRVEVNGQGDLGVLLLDYSILHTQRKDAFLQRVRQGFLKRKPVMLLAIGEEKPLDLFFFPAKIIEKDGKIIYAKADPVA